jgi:hypothetical protein
MRWGYGGWRWSYDGEEGGGGELDAQRMKNGERRAQATLTGDESRDGGDGRTATGFGHGRRCGFRLRQRHGQDRARRFGQRQRRGRNGAVGTPARSPDNAFNTLERRSVWQPCGNGTLPGGPGADSGV